MAFVNKITRKDGTVRYQEGTYGEVDLNDGPRLFRLELHAEAAAKRLRRFSAIASVEVVPVIVTLVEK